MWWTAAGAGYHICTCPTDGYADPRATDGDPYTGSADCNADTGASDSDPDSRVQASKQNR
jgi:hypothetical protein